MHLNDVIEYRIEIWTRTFLNIRLTITEGFYFSVMSARYIFVIAKT